MNRMKVKIPESVRFRKYQEQTIDEALLLAKEQPSQPHLFSSPCGTGKSLMELGLMEAVDDSILVTPRVEIISGMLNKLGCYTEDMSYEELTNLSSNYGIFTPVKLRNWLCHGKLPWLPELLLIDECHHSTADTYDDMAMYLNGIPTIGFTATPYRGTPKGTKELHDKWGDVVNRVLTLKKTFEMGYNVLPTPTMLPLVDDDLIEVSNGEISASAADAVITDRLEAIVRRVMDFYNTRARMYDRTTMIAVPSTNIVKEMEFVFNKFNLPCVTVTQATSRKDRQRAFKKTMEREAVLIQIDVVSEGVDLPFRRLIDVKPTLSPVRWMQQMGRIMRPTMIGEPLPEYICCCRNLERHCYLMEEAYPADVIVDAQKAFNAPTRRAGMRAIGLEGLGRFVTTPVETLHGIIINTYNICHVNNYQRTEYFAMVHPGYTDPVIGERTIPIVDNKPDWKQGRWRLIERIPDLKGCTTVREYPPTGPQMERWKSDAAKVGLNPLAMPNSRNIQAFFFMRDLKLKYGM